MPRGWGLLITPKGYIMATGQMVRFAATVIVNALGIVGMNGFKVTLGGIGMIFPFAEN